MKRPGILVLLMAAGACGGGSLNVRRIDGGGTDLVEAFAQGDQDGSWSSTGDTFASDAAPLPVPAGCENVRFDGTFFAGTNDMSFAQALQMALRQKALGHLLLISIDGISSTDGLECFDGLTDRIVLRNCSDPLRITKMPKGLKEVDVDPTCTVIDIAGLQGVGRVVISDASLTSDFSPLADSSFVQVFGGMPLETIAPYVKNASVLFLGVTATSLAPLNSASANYMWVEAEGLHSVGDYIPSPTLTCFEIRLDPTATSEESAAMTDQLCTIARSAPECPNYACCWQPYVFGTGPLCTSTEG